MTVRNRKREIKSFSNQHDEMYQSKRGGKDPQKESDDEESLDCVIEAGQPPVDKAAGKVSTLLTLVALVVHLIAVGIVVYGAVLGHVKVFHHEECTMTYSWRVFLPTSLKSESTPYRLYQFMDSRDNRFRALMQAQKPLTGNQGCWNGTSTAILYIPGHGGDFEQSRSIGAHGMQMTHRNDDRVRRHKIQRALQSQEFSGDADELDNFVFPVYAADFQEEGTGMHSIFTQHQASFVAESVQYLVESSCGYQQILIVAHSMGGHAAQLAYQDHKSIQPYVNNIITLGTPHAFPVLAFDRSLYNLHHRMLVSGSSDSDLAVISISGGLRDEMIPVEACEALNLQQSRTMSLLASSIMKRKKDLTEDTLDIGCDHRALVWCHNLLTSIRTIIFHLIQSQRDGLIVEDRLSLVASKALERPEQSTMYKQLVSGSYSNLDRELGIWNALAVETGFVHNSNLLLSAYNIVGTFYATFPGSRQTTSASFLVLVIPFYLRYASVKPIFTALLLMIALTAHAVFWAFHYCFRFLASQLPIVPTKVLLSLGVSMTLLGPVCSILSVSGRLQAATMIGFTTFYLSLILGGLISESKHQYIFAAWTFPMLPILLAGNIYASWKRPHAVISGTPIAWCLVLSLCARWLLVSRLETINKRDTKTLDQTRKVFSMLRYAAAGWVLVVNNPLDFVMVEKLLCFCALDIMEVVVLSLKRI